MLATPLSILAIFQPLFKLSFPSCPLLVSRFGWLLVGPMDSLQFIQLKETNKLHAFGLIYCSVCGHVRNCSDILFVCVRVCVCVSERVLCYVFS